MKLLLILLLLPLNLFSQKELSLHLNARNAKTTDQFDYYSKLTLVVVDTSYTLNLMGNFERDEGVNYYSYSCGIEFKYASTEYYKDTEKEVEYLSLALFYPVSDWLRIGYNYMRTEVSYHSIFIGLRWKFIYVDLSFFDKIHKLKAVANPQYNLTKKLKLGIEAGIISIQNELKWVGGLTFNYKLK